MLIFCKKILTSAKLREPLHQKVYFLKLHMYVYLRTKFYVSSRILTSFRQDVVPPPTTLKQAPKKPTQIRVKECFSQYSFYIQ